MDAIPPRAQIGFLPPLDSVFKLSKNGGRASSLRSQVSQTRLMTPIPATLNEDMLLNPAI